MKRDGREVQVSLEMQVQLVQLVLQDREAMMDVLVLRATRDLLAQREMQEQRDLLDSQVTLASVGIVDQMVAMECLE